MPPRTQFREEREELETVLNSGIFARSPSLAQFLRYICERYFEGHGEDIKEYNVAVEALGRPAVFDQKKDSIVRVEAHRLRKRLQDYYSGTGAGHPFQISIPPGSYVPVFMANGHHAHGTAAPEIPEPPQDEAMAEGEREPAGPSRARRWMAPGFVAGAMIAGVLGYAGWRQLQPDDKTLPATATITAGAIPGDEVRILAGSSEQRYVDEQGNVWGTDRFYSGGEAAQAPKRPILRTRDASLYLARREGASRYDIPLKPGVYELRLHFAETVFGENNEAGGGESSRIFQIFANGQMLEAGLDVIADAAGSNTADIKVYKDIAPAADGNLHLEFRALLKEKPFVNAIEVVPSSKGVIRPIRILAAEKGYTTPAGVHWGPNRLVHGGQNVRRRDDVTGTDDQELFRTEQFGNFSYAIPVAARSRYTVRLGLCEHWFGTGRAGGGGAGNRIFDVYANRKTLLKNFDIFAEAGPLRAIVKTFSGLEPNAQGKLYLEFVPVNNYALVNFIEVIDEGTTR
jgi:hypothetical protein